MRDQFQEIWNKNILQHKNKAIFIVIKEKQKKVRIYMKESRNWKERTDNK